MIYTSLDRIKENIINRNWLFWRVYQKDEKSTIAECINIENLTPKKSADYLSEEIAALQGSGYIIIKLYQKPPQQGGNNTGTLNFYVRINEGSEEGGTPVGNTNNMNFGMINGFYQQIQDLNLKLLQEQQKAALKEIENKYEAKNNKTEVDPIFKELLGVAKVALASKSNPNQNTVQNVPINGINDKKDFTDTIKKWAALDPNYIQAMKAIVHFAEVDPDSYKTYLNLLIDKM